MTGVVSAASASEQAQGAEAAFNLQIVSYIASLQAQGSSGSAYEFHDLGISPYVSYVPVFVNAVMVPVDVVSTSVPVTSNSVSVPVEALLSEV
jgi:hypothetical protein